MNINKVYGVMNQLESQSGKIVKEQILKNNEGNEDFREALVFLLNPYIVTGISTKKMNKKLKEDLQVKGFISSFKHLLEYLKDNSSGKDGDIMIIQNFANSQKSEELKTFVKRFVTKDLKLGISEKTVNKVYGEGTIPSFAVMLAESFAKKEAKVKGKFYITLKMDGNRCVAIRENDKVKFYSRKGQEIEGLSELAENFKSFQNGFAYDGELLLVNDAKMPSDELFRATQKVVRKDGEKKNIEFHMFDALPLSEFKAGKSKKTYEQRRNSMDLMFDKLEKELPLLKLLPVLYAGEDKSLIPAMMKTVEELGFEGLMINTANGLYLNKRTDGLMKVKTMKSADLLVMSIEKSIDGQFKDLMGRVNVEYKGGICGVGSGFTLEQRRLYVENPDLICGKVIEVQFFEESKDEKTGQLSLRFPVFKSIRHDKGVDDINYGE